MWKNGKQYAQAWNFGPHEEDVVPVEKVVQSTIRVWGAGNYTITPDPAKKEAHLLMLSIKKAQEQLCWNPVYRFDQAIQQTIRSTK
jgi:CDP-glucose 4,6-dehydratase